MAKVPGHGNVKTRLSHYGDAERERLAWAFLRDKLAQVVSIPSTHAVVAFTPEAGFDTLALETAGQAELLLQPDGDLGARLAAIAEKLLERGHVGVVLLDADTPNLPTDRIREAVVALNAGVPLVLGPAWDGGYYLIGLGARQPSLFCDVPWSTSRVMAATLERAERAGLSVYMLPAWYDVDQPADLDRLRRQLAESGEHAPGDPKATRQLLAPESRMSSPRLECWRTVSSRSIYENPWLRVDEHVVLIPDRAVTTLYGVVSCRPCVGIVPMLDEENVVLVRQFRYVEQRHTLEIPTGGVHAEEDVLSSARRELREEIGYDAETLEPLGTYRTSKSVMDEVAHLFVGRGLRARPLPADETEQTETVVTPFRQALAWVEDGSITDSMTIIALLHMALRRRD